LSDDGIALELEEGYLDAMTGVEPIDEKAW
jgi:hypothetical protein